MLIATLPHRGALITIDFEIEGRLDTAGSECRVVIYDAWSQEYGDAVVLNEEQKKELEHDVFEWWLIWSRLL